MMKYYSYNRVLFLHAHTMRLIMPNFLLSSFTVVILSCSLAACGGSSSSTPEPPVIEPPITTETPPVIVPNSITPVVDNASANTSSLGNYEKYQLAVQLTAQYNNPYDQREIALNAVFTSPSNEVFNVAGFWDDNLGWTIRFTPSEVGQWTYNLSATDKNGTSDLITGDFTTTQSTDSGWIQSANMIDDAYSSRYFMHQDGSEFYGIGHGDVFSIFRTANSASRLLTRLKSADENYFIWWPFFDFSPVESNFDTYDQSNLNLIDDVLELTETADLKMVFTLWDHPQLRDSTHFWDDGRWDNNNGFSQLISATDFFTDNEAWEWQENLYRYIIARWGYSSAIAMWQTVSEIDGTNAFENTNPWHEKVNSYFVENDPYRHPTTASKAGDLNWPEGHAVMDSPQVHIYRDLLTDKDNATSPAKIVESAEIIANYTIDMWDAQAKPNWIGEFGVMNSTTNEDLNSYPELFHNALWSALAAGAAATPAEWNDFDDWGQITDSMELTLQNFSQFVEQLSLAKWNPEQLIITSANDTKVWGVAGQQGGLIWLQDVRLKGESISSIRTLQTTYPPSTLEVTGLAPGEYEITPYNTKLGTFVTPFSITCVTGTPCLIQVSSFLGDIALRIEERPSLN